MSFAMIACALFMGVPLSARHESIEIRLRSTAELRARDAHTGNPGIINSARRFLWLLRCDNWTNSGVETRPVFPAFIGFY